MRRTYYVRIYIYIPFIATDDFDQESVSHHTYSSLLLLHVADAMSAAGVAGTSTCFAWKPGGPRMIAGIIIIYGDYDLEHILPLLPDFLLEVVAIQNK